MRILLNRPSRTGLPTGLIIKLSILLGFFLAGPSSISAQEQGEKPAESEKVPEGHSYHGEAFNEGPRQSAYLMKGTGGVTFPVSTENARVQGVDRKGDGLLFKLERASLPSFSASGGIREVLKVRGLGPGQYALKVDGAEVLQADAKEWKAGVGVPGGPDFDRIEKIRKLAVEKNFFYFHRYRPANWPYIYGFRRHEQGRNAVEIPLFDPLIKEKEAAIAGLSKPVGRTYELARVKGGAK